MIDGTSAYLPAHFIVEALEACGRCKLLPRRHRPPPSVAAPIHLTDKLLLRLGRKQVEVASPIRNRTTVDVDHLCDTLGNPIGSTSHNDARVTVPSQQDIVQVLVADQVDNVVDVGIEPDVWSAEVGALSAPGFL